MPVVTPFGDLKLNDEVGLAAWLDAHDRRHQLYVRKLKVPGGSLMGPVTGDWMLRHHARHLAIAKRVKDPIPTANTQILGLPGPWRTDQELSDWHLLHNRLHARIDRASGIKGLPPG